MWEKPDTLAWSLRNYYAPLSIIPSSQGEGSALHRQGTPGSTAAVNELKQRFFRNSDLYYVFCFSQRQVEFRLLSKGIKEVLSLLNSKERILIKEY